MIDLLKTLYTELAKVHPNVHYEYAKSNTVAPFIVFKLPNSNEAENREDFTLEVNVVDVNPDTTNLETIVSGIVNHFKNLRLMTESSFLIFHKEGRFMVPDPDPNLRKRRIRFIVKQYER